MADLIYCTATTDPQSKIAAALHFIVVKSEMIATAIEQQLGYRRGKNIIGRPTFVFSNNPNPFRQADEHFIFVNEGGFPEAVAGIERLQLPRGG